VFCVQLTAETLLLLLPLLQFDYTSVIDLENQTCDGDDDADGYAHHGGGELILGCAAGECCYVRDA